MRPNPDSATRGPTPCSSASCQIGKHHDLLVDQLLDAMEERLALLRVQLARLLPEEPVDVGVSAVGEGAARDRERLDPGGRVAEDAAQAVDDVLELLLLVRLEERRALERAEPAP